MKAVREDATAPSRRASEAEVGLRPVVEHEDEGTA
eukprot:CAMPEP_0179104592 /NCGR_PEP_ID=MMETSP0796-20121207/48526_1 /TAXON_ID=73915 /ORGANISM="Pyrodinium bahamense, Strain pbaha01" /LENGTH=34 /DNA_ID= /DNA_START= /DNA_END= /DNA_ORIENTATION=